MVNKVFGTGSEYNYEKFHCLDFDFGLVNFKISQHFVWVALVRAAAL